MDAKPNVSEENKVFSGFGHPSYKITAGNLAIPTNKSHLNSTCQDF
jgi:hypothetical protein